MSNMKRIRHQLGLKQKDIAKRLGVTAQYLGQVENRKNNISQELIIRLAQIYNVPATDLL